MTTAQVVLVANVLWFGFFVYGILEWGWSEWILIIPVLIHWSASDFESDKPGFKD